MNMEIRRNSEEWAMPGEVEAYLEAFNEAERSVLRLKVVSHDFENIAKALQNVRAAPYQQIPANLPTSGAIREMQERARAAIEKCKQIYAQVPGPLRMRLPNPDAVGARGQGMPIDDPDIDSGYSR